MKDKVAWHAVVYGVAKSQTELSEQQQCQYWCPHLKEEQRKVQRS